MRNKILKLLSIVFGDRVYYIYSIWGLRIQFINACKILKGREIPHIKFYTDDETVDLITKEKKSIGRYGDGEIRWMAGLCLDSFQNTTDRFVKDLRDSFNCSNPNILIGIPLGLFDSSKCNLFAKMYWKIILANNIDLLTQFLDTNRKYINASITRPYIDYNDYSYSKENFERVKKIWDKKDVVIVEGEYSMLGMGNNLFQNAASIRRIICPAKNAYDKIDGIKETIIKKVTKDTLLLGALGPTASILASQLTILGYQFIDIGHIDIEYMWFLKHSIIRDTIPGKYVNESSKKIDNTVDYSIDPTYCDSIIAKIL